MAQSWSWGSQIAGSYAKILIFCKTLTQGIKKRKFFNSEALLYQHLKFSVKPRQLKTIEVEFMVQQ